MVFFEYKILAWRRTVTQCAVAIVLRSLAEDCNTELWRGLELRSPPPHCTAHCRVYSRAAPARTGRCCTRHCSNIASQSAAPHNTGVVFTPHLDTAELQTGDAGITEQTSSCSGTGEWPRLMRARQAGQAGLHPRLHSPTHWSVRTLAHCTLHTAHCTLHTTMKCQNN